MLHCVEVLCYIFIIILILRGTVIMHLSTEELGVRVNHLNPLTLPPTFLVDLRLTVAKFVYIKFKHVGTVEPFYRRHFGTQNFLSSFVMIKRLSSIRGKKCTVGP